MEVRDRINAGFTRVIVPTGGVEQNGPFVVLGKHNRIVREVSDRAAKILGNTLVAPVVAFVPEGEITPPTGHMAYSGTISVAADTFQLLMRDIIASLAAHGFTEILIVADSGGTLPALKAFEAGLSNGVVNGARVRFIPEFYNYDLVRAFLKERGYGPPSEHFHEELDHRLPIERKAEA